MNRIGILTIALLSSFSFFACSSAPNVRPEDVDYTFSFDDPSDMKNFTLTQGARLSTDEVWSIAEVDASEARVGTGSLKVSADADTKKFYFVGKQLPTDKRFYKYYCYVKGADIQKEAKQYNNCYVGFLARYKDGTKKFFVKQYHGTFDWRRSYTAADIRNDQDKIQSMVFGVFLSKTGTFWVDEVQLFLD